VQNFEGKHADIALCGHLDVVPPSKEGQFEAYEEDGKLYGRGCGDMKDGCAIMITLIQELLSSGFTDKKIALWLTADEEIGGKDGMLALVQDGWETDVAIIPDS
jgi:acetylornithine deacetylase/succinyl-diaminopimelate desuccinylase-like protein